MNKVRLKTHESDLLPLEKAYFLRIFRVFLAGDGQILYYSFEVCSGLDHPFPASKS